MPGGAPGARRRHRRANEEPHLVEPVPSRQQGGVVAPDAVGVVDLADQGDVLLGGETSKCGSRRRKMGTPNSALACFLVVVGNV